ncbi:MAG: triose-phosphate isomerase, partial [Candidatus Omnitrophota bacterium]
FDKGPIDPGTLRHYPPGVRENAGQYTHAATWLPFALSLTGETEEAYRIFRNLLPANHDQDWYEAEPFWVSADVSPDGKAGWNMYTGSASWLFRAGIEAVLGLSFERGRLVSMKRPLPAALGTVRLRVHGRDYVLSPNGDLSQADGGDIDMDAALPRILKEMSCEECYIPDFAEEIKLLFPPELLAQWRDVIRQVFDAAAASRVTVPVVLEKSEKERPMLSVTAGAVHIRSPWDIHQLLVYTLPVEHVFEAIEYSSLPKHEKDRMFRSFFTCLNNTAFVYLVLTLLGYEVKVAMGSGPVFAVIPYSNGTHMFVDLFTGVIKAVDIPAFYAQKGKYLVLAKRLSIRRHFELKLSEFDVRSLRDEELLQLFYSYLRMGDARCLMVVMYKKVAHIYDQLGQKQAAYRYYKKSLDLDPDYIVAHIGLAFLCLERMDIRCAVQRFAAAQKLNPCEYGAYLGLGLAYRLQRKRGKAVDNFARAVAIAPSHLDMISTMDSGLQDAVLLRLSAYIPLERIEKMLAALAEDSATQPDRERCVGRCRDGGKQSRGLIWAIGAQDVSTKRGTGKTRPKKLREKKVEFCMVGHPEIGDSLETVNEKAKELLSAGISPMIFVFDRKKERDEGRTKQVLRDQLRIILAGIPPEQIEEIVIVYLPMWVKELPLEEQKAMDPQEVQEIMSSVRTWLAERYSQETAQNIYMLYGRGVHDGNVLLYMVLPDVDGVFVYTAAFPVQGAIRIVRQAGSRLWPRTPLVVFNLKEGECDDTSCYMHYGSDLIDQVGDIFETVVVICPNVADLEMFSLMRDIKEEQPLFSARIAKALRKMLRSIGLRIKGAASSVADKLAPSSIPEKSYKDGGARRRQQVSENDRSCRDATFKDFFREYASLGYVNFVPLSGYMPADIILDMRIDMPALYYDPDHEYMYLMEKEKHGYLKTPSVFYNVILEHITRSLDLSTALLDTEDLFWSIRDVPGEYRCFSRVIREIWANSLEALCDARCVNYRGEIRIQVRLNLERLTISFRDNGIGLNGLDPEKPFEKHFSTKNKRYNNQGLGLTYSRYFVEQAYSGRLFLVENSDSRGVTAFIELPFCHLRELSEGTRGRRGQNSIAFKDGGALTVKEVVTGLLAGTIVIQAQGREKIKTPYGEVDLSKLNDIRNNYRGKEAIFYLARDMEILRSSGLVAFKSHGPINVRSVCSALPDNVIQANGIIKHRIPWTAFFQKDVLQRNKTGDGSTLRDICRQMEKGEMIIAPDGYEVLQTPYGRIDLKRLNDLDNYTGIKGLFELAMELDLAGQAGYLHIVLHGSQRSVHPNSLFEFFSEATRRARSFHANTLPWKQYFAIQRALETSPERYRFNTGLVRLAREFGLSMPQQAYYAFREIAQELGWNPITYSMRQLDELGGAEKIAGFMTKYGVNLNYAVQAMREFPDEIDPYSDTWFLDEREIALRRDYLSGAITVDELVLEMMRIYDRSRLFVDPAVSRVASHAYRYGDLLVRDFKGHDAYSNIRMRRLQDSDALLSRAIADEAVREKFMRAVEFFLGLAQLDDWPFLSVIELDLALIRMAAAGDADILLKYESRYYAFIQWDVAEEFVQQSQDGLEASLRVAAISNGLDLVDPDSAAKYLNDSGYLSRSFGDLYRWNFWQKNDISLFKEFLGDTQKTVMIVMDNAGEHVLNMPLVQWLRSNGHRVILAGKSLPAANDVTDKDISELMKQPEVRMSLEGLTGGIKVIATGTIGLGTDPMRVSSAFRTAWNTSDIVLFMGEANYIAMYDFGPAKPSFFLFKTKWPQALH